MKLFAILIFLAILASLGSAVFYLVKDRSGTDRTVKALTWRIGLSVALFALLMLGYHLGWIEPTNSVRGPS